VEGNGHGPIDFHALYKETSTYECQSQWIKTCWRLKIANVGLELTLPHQIPLQLSRFVHNTHTGIWWASGLRETLGACSHVVHQTQTQKGAKSCNILLEGSSLVICPTHSLYMSFINYESHDENQYLTIHKALHRNN
jgi:hypothetical protein